MRGADIQTSASADAHASVRCGNAQPLGVPVIFMQEWLASSARGLSLMGRETCTHLLVREYAQARGYSFDWGQLIEQRLGDVVVWRVVPVALWTDKGRQAVAVRPDDAQQAAVHGGIVALTGALQALVREHVPLRPHPDVMRSGCSGGGQRTPHALLSLLCTQPQRLAEVRAWLESQFLDQTLPGLLSACCTWLDEAGNVEAARASAPLLHADGDKRAAVWAEPPSDGGVQRAKRSA